MRGAPGETDTRDGPATANAGFSRSAIDAELFLIRAAITLLTGRSVYSSGLRQLLFGLVAAGLTYGIGRVLGVTLAG